MQIQIQIQIRYRYRHMDVARALLDISIYLVGSAVNFAEGADGCLAHVSVSVWRAAHQPQQLFIHLEGCGHARMLVRYACVHMVCSSPTPGALHTPSRMWICTCVCELYMYTYGKQLPNARSSSYT